MDNSGSVLLHTTVDGNVRTVGSYYLCINAPYISAQRVIYHTGDKITPSPPPPPGMNFRADFLQNYALTLRVRTAVPCWGQTTDTLSVLSPKRDCGPKTNTRNENGGFGKIYFRDISMGSLLGVLTLAVAENICLETGPRERALRVISRCTGYRFHGVREEVSIFFHESPYVHVQQW